ncbi:phosphatidylinositol N-acetylglucosaminyltransferase subunit A [Nematocida sp. AWRm80]|nr:phosphatidylinositol N-acetylglucosaminyltransferase subunit A [Nematocida sp. AWRm80]
MVSDFFYPRVGGVENHILNISKELQGLGHKIIIITHANTGVSGIRRVQGFKVYYLEQMPIFGGAVFPTFVCTAFPVGRIFLRERIEIVHAHQCTTLAIEGIFHASMLGIPRCFTNHSLVKPNTLGGVITSSAIQLSMIDIDQIICVSQACRNNSAERLEIPAERIKVIPNAVTDHFYPNRLPETKNNKDITIAVVSRLTFRKGAALLSQTLRGICNIDPNIQIVIAGEGDQKELLEQTVEYYDLSERVTFLGSINSKEVVQLLNRSNLFLNTSLTEAFCITILEAAACGLYVVSTDVDGIREVLPEEMITLSPPTPNDLIRSIKEALPKIATYNPELAHQKVISLYQWPTIAKETDVIYKQIYKKYSSHSPSLNFRQFYAARAHLFSLPYTLIMLINYLILSLVLFLYKNTNPKQ